MDRRVAGTRGKDQSLSLVCGGSGEVSRRGSSRPARASWQIPEALGERKAQTERAVAWDGREEVAAGLQGDLARLIQRVTIGTGAEGWKGDRFAVVFRRQLQAAVVGRLQQVCFALVASSPVRPDSMDHVAAIQITGG